MSYTPRRFGSKMIKQAGSELSTALFSRALQLDFSGSRVLGLMSAFFPWGGYSGQAGQIHWHAGLISLFVGSRSGTGVELEIIASRSSSSSALLYFKKLMIEG